MGLGVFQMSELVVPGSARWTAGHWSLDLGMEVAGGDQGRSAHNELLEVQEVEGLRDRIVQEGSDWRQAINMHHGSQWAGAVLVGLHRRVFPLLPTGL